MASCCSKYQVLPSSRNVAVCLYPDPLLQKKNLQPKLTQRDLLGRKNSEEWLSQLGWKKAALNSTGTTGTGLIQSF